MSRNKEELLSPLILIRLRQGYDGLKAAKPCVARRAKHGSKDEAETGQETIKQIQNILAEIRPYILNDGGDIEFVSFIDGIVSVKLIGACVSCPMSIFTLKLGIEEKLKEQIPQVQQVVAI